jgi:alkaline phosphatase
MTQSALRVLQKSLDSGFVLFIENEHIDAAGHFSDVAALIHEFIAFDRAIGAAYEFYRQHPEDTLILITSDHDTGGLNLTSSAIELPSGRRSLTNPTWDHLRKIATIQISFRKASALLGPNPTPEAFASFAAEHFKGFILSPEVREWIAGNKPSGARFVYSRTAAALGALVAHNTHAYWSTSGHTGQPVFVAALGSGAERFRGYQDNTDFAKHLFALLGEAKPRSPDR